jgi:hypothetical protein
MITLGVAHYYAASWPAALATGRATLRRRRLGRGGAGVDGARGTRRGLTGVRWMG